MLGSEALDIATGLVLVFLLVSIMLTALAEILEAFFKTRAADLEHAIARMMTRAGTVPPPTNPIWVADLYNHSLIAALYPDGYKTATQASPLLFGRWRGNNLPSYIPRDLFSAAVLDLVGADAAAKSAPIAQVVATLGNVAGLPARRAALENWYDGVMDRVSGAYKRRTQHLMFWLGLAIALAFNINPIAITTYLRESPDARREIVTLAREVQGASGAPGQVAVPAVCAPTATDPAAADRCQAAIAGVGLPLGWQAAARYRAFPHAYEADHFTFRCALWSVLDALFLLLGCAITGLAATLGAPFWFDTLNKVMIVRSTVKPKEKSRDEASADRQ